MASRQRGSSQPGALVKTYAPRHLEDDNDRDDGLAYREFVHRYLIDLSCQATAEPQSDRSWARTGSGFPTERDEAAEGYRGRRSPTSPV